MFCKRYYKLRYSAFNSEKMDVLKSATYFIYEFKLGHSVKEEEKNMNSVFWKGNF